MVQRLEEAWQILGIPANSDPEQVVEAYRRLARATHPDVSADPDAAARFATLTWAYKLVSATARSERPAGRPQEGGDLPRTHHPTAATAAGGGAGFVDAQPRTGASPYLRAGTDRPPIVAGPVLVRRFRDDTQVGEVRWRT